MATTGEIIKLIRKTRGLTQDELGDILGVKKSAIQKYESGAICNLKHDVIRKFFLELKIPPWVFFFPETLSLDEIKNMNDINWGNISLLNEEGRAKVIAYIDDLVEIKKYRIF